MHQTKNGNQSCFGMKDHAGVDRGSGLLYSVVVTAANKHVLTPAAELLHGDEKIVYADAVSGHRQKSSEGRQNNGHQIGDATQKTPRLA
ncbi:protein of unknown function [Cyanobium sp. NIES-981]|nr:protein of unknown function [Cyanobium sp. NIES-981]